MNAANKDNERLIYEIAADILARSRESNKYSLDVSRLREEIKKDIENRNVTFGKFRELLEGLRNVIPGEEKLYQAAIKSLYTTSGISQKDVLDAADLRLSDLKKLEEAFKAVLGGWRDDIKGLESKAREIKKEIAKFRDMIGKLEKEERQILGGMESRSKEIELAQNGVTVLMADIAAEVKSIKSKVETLASEREVVQPASPPAPVMSGGPEQDVSGDAEEVVSGAAVEAEIQPMSESQDAEGQRKCSVCGGQSMWYESEKIWKCYVCGHEDKGDAGAPAVRQQTAATPNPEPPRAMTVAAPQEISSSQKSQSAKTKTCPICKKKMEWYDAEKSWRCPFCKYQRMAF